MEDHKHTINSEIIVNPPAEFGVKYRLWQGCPSIARTRGGRLYAGWYSGGRREPSMFNYNLLIRSDDEGLTWSKPLLVINSIPDKLLQSLDIQLWTDPSGKLWVFYTQRNYNSLPQWTPDHLNTWAVCCKDPDADEPQWEEPRFICCGFLRCQPTVLSDGRILLPAYDWSGERYQYFVSNDNGETFQRRFAGKKVKTPFDEGMFLERKDKSILLFARTSTGYIAKCESFDGGETWTDGENTDIPNPSTRVCIMRLKSGRVLLVNNMDSKERVAMTALLSDDDGKTFTHTMLLDNCRNVSYPDVVQGDDGTIYIIWDRDRMETREVVIARLTETDIIAGKVVEGSSFCGHIVSKSIIPDAFLQTEPLRSFMEAEVRFFDRFNAEVYRDGGDCEKFREAVMECKKYYQAMF